MRNGIINLAMWKVAKMNEEIKIFVCEYILNNNNNSAINEINQIKIDFIFKILHSSTFYISIKYLYQHLIIHYQYQGISSFILTSVFSWPQSFCCDCNKYYY